MLPTSPASSFQDIGAPRSGISFIGLAMVAAVVTVIGMAAVLPPRVVVNAGGDDSCVTVAECDELGGEAVTEAEEPAPMLGPGHVDSFAVNCLRTAATAITASCGQVSYEAQVPDSATADVVFGDASITASAGGLTRTAGDINGGNLRTEYCRTTLDAGVAIEVRAMCPTAPAAFIASVPGEVEWRGGVDGDRVPPPPCYPGSPYECERGR